MIEDVLIHHRKRKNSITTDKKKNLERLKSGEENLKRQYWYIMNNANYVTQLALRLGLERMTGVVRYRFNQCDYSEQRLYIDSLIDNLWGNIIMNIILEGRQYYLFPVNILEMMKKYKILVYGAGRYASQIICELAFNNIIVQEVY